MSVDPAPPPVHTERRRRVVGWQSRDVLRAAALVTGFYLTLRLLWFANTLFLTAFLGILFGLAVSSGVDRLARLRIPRGIAAAIIVFGFFGLLGAFGAWSAPTLRAQSRELKVKLPEAVDKVEQWVGRRQQGFFGIFLGGSADSVAAGTPDTAAAPASAAQGAQGAQGAQSTDTGGGAGGEAARDTTQAPRGAGAAQGAQAAQGEREPTGSLAGPAPGSSLRERLGGQLRGATRYLFPFLSSTMAVFGGLLLIVFLSIYIAAEPRLYHDGLMHLFPHRVRKRAGEVLSAMAVVLRRWLVTQLIAMVVIGVVSTSVLLLLGVKAAVALGMLAGLLEFVPMVGPLLSAIPAVAMGFLDSPEKAGLVALAYIAIQFLENHILIPLLMKGGVDIPPALTLMAQALMALLFGFLGLMVAVPMLAAAMVPIKMLYVEGVVGDDVEILGGADDDAEPEGA